MRSKWIAPIAGSVLAILGQFQDVLQPYFVKYPWLGPTVGGVALILGSLMPQPQKPSGQ